MTKISDKEVCDLMRKHEKPSMDFLNNLKFDLSIRENNNHAGSGLGGNVSQFFYLLTKNVKSIYSDDDNIHIYQDGNELIFKIPPCVNSILSFRKALDKFWENCPDKITVTEREITNSDFLKTQQVNKMDVLYLIKAIDLAKDVIVWLDRSSEFEKHICNFIDLEIKNIERQYLSEMDLPLDHFVNVDLLNETRHHMRGMNFEYDFVASSMKKHPIWSKKLESIRNRKRMMIDQLLSEEDLFKLNMIGSFPIYISTFVLRSIIGIERTVSRNLDENLEWMKNINNISNKISDESNSDTNEPYEE